MDKFKQCLGVVMVWYLIAIGGFYTGSLLFRGIVGQASNLRLAERFAEITGQLGNGQVLAYRADTEDFEPIGGFPTKANQGGKKKQ